MADAPALGAHCRLRYTAVQQDLRMGANDPQLQRLTALVTGGAWLALNTTSPLAPLSASSLMAGTPRSTPGGDRWPATQQKHSPSGDTTDYAEQRVIRSRRSAGAPPARLGAGAVDCSA